MEGPHRSAGAGPPPEPQLGLRQSPFGLSLTPMSCVQLLAVPAVPVPVERSWQSHTLLESAEFDAIVFPDVSTSKKIPSFRLCRIVLPCAFTDSGTVLVTSMPSFTAYLIVLNPISTPTGPDVSSANPSRTATPENG